MKDRDVPLMYRITIDFEADDPEQANNAIDVVKATLPYVVDNIDVGLFHYGYKYRPGHHLLPDEDDE